MKNFSENPFLSVIIPAYNAEKTIGECLESIGDRSDTEIIVINDCSSDDTAEKTKAAGFSNVFLVRLESRVGPGIARNAGLDAARGEYILFLDSDDCLGDGFMNTAETVLREESPDLLLSRRTLEVESKCRFIPRDIRLGKRQKRIERKTPLPPYVTGVFFKREIIEENGLRFSEKFFFEDGEFLAAFRECAGPGIYDPGLVYRYRLFSDSLTQRDENLAEIYSGKLESEKNIPRRIRIILSYSARAAAVGLVPETIGSNSVEKFLSRFLGTPFLAGGLKMVYSLRLCFQKRRLEKNG